MEDGKFNVLPGKSIVSDQDLLRYNSVKELFNYIDDKDAKVEKVKILIKKANRELRPMGKKLYVRKAHSHDKDAENRICITTR